MVSRTLPHKRPDTNWPLRTLVAMVYNEVPQWYLPR